MSDDDLPLAFRWFVKRGIHPWDFDVGSEAHIAWFNKQYRLETGADHDVRLFANRGDIDDCRLDERRGSGRSPED